MIIDYHKHVHKHIYEAAKKEILVQASAGAIYSNEVISSHLHGLELNILGRPTSSGNITTVPVGPMTHFMVLDANACDLAAFSCIT